MGELVDRTPNPRAADGDPPSPAAAGLPPSSLVPGTMADKTARQA